MSTSAPTPESCPHPSDALAVRPASALSRAVVQTCGACQQQWVIGP